MAEWNMVKVFDGDEQMRLISLAVWISRFVSPTTPGREAR